MVDLGKRGEDTSTVQAQTDSRETLSSSLDMDSNSFPMHDLHALGSRLAGSSSGSQWSESSTSFQVGTETIASLSEDGFSSTLDDYTLVERRNDGTEQPARRYLNNANSLSKGYILSRSMKTEYTIILVGETGVGKTSLLTFIWNVLNTRLPREYRLQIYDRNNESGLGSGASQTNDAKLYTFTSANGVVLRILDTPGLSDTRGMHLDNQHKEKIAQSIKDLIVSVDAVLIVANGTNPRLTASSSYALTSLSSLFPKSLGKNIGMLFTNVADPISRNFEESSLPESLQGAESFCLDNPASLEAKRRVDPRARPSARARQRDRVADAHQDALETMAELFDWLDSRYPQPTNDIVALHEYSVKIERQILNTQSQLAQAVNATQSLERLQRVLDTNQADLMLLRNFDSIVLRRTFDLERSDVPVNACHYPGCHENCHIDCNGAQGFFWWVNPKRCRDCWGHTLKLWVYPKCNTCGHDHNSHSLSNSVWATREHANDAGDAATRESLFTSMTEREKKEHLFREIDDKLAHYARQKDENMGILADLAESYAVNALAGDYSSQLEEGIRISKENIRAMCETGGDQVVIAKMRVSVTVLERKLKTLKDAQAKKQQRIFSVDRMISNIESFAGMMTPSPSLALSKYD